MELKTFGGVLRFAIELETKIIALYEEMSRDKRCQGARQDWLDLLREHKKCLDLLERTRRENVAEMILEPIRGLSSDDYDLQTAFTPEMSYLDVVKLALKLEERSQEFYANSAEKISGLGEASKPLRKLAKERERYKLKLKSLTSFL